MLSFLRCAVHAIGCVWVRKYVLLVVCMYGGACCMCLCVVVFTSCHVLCVCVVVAAALLLLGFYLRSRLLPATEVVVCACVAHSGI